MSRKTLVVVAFAICLLFSCNKENPVSPTEPGNNGGGNNGGSGYVVTVTSNPGSLNAGENATPATITVKAQLSDGSTAPDGTPVTISTTLGNFGTSALGEALKVVNKTMSGGQATAVFYGGTTTGTANILASVGTSVGQTSVPIATPPPLPVPNFEYVLNGLEVIFTDSTTGATSRSWDFGDGSAPSTDVNPRHTYAKADTYHVILTAKNSNGDSAQKTKAVTLGATEEPKANFTFETSGLLVHFTDMSTGNPTKWDWDFGDGTLPHGTTQNPSHTYEKAGTYTVTLQVTNAFGTTAKKSGFVEVSLGNPVAAFTFEASGLTVHFTDQSTGSPTQWLWEFGDAKNSTSTLKNPSFTYDTPGSYTVKLTVKNTHGVEANVSRFVEASLGVAPVADYDFEVSTLRAVFTDKSTNKPTSWAWNFGDCADSPGTCTSTEQNAAHTYAKAGSYEVSLTATNAAGSSPPKKKIVKVSLGDPPVAKFGYTPQDLKVFFVDQSTGNPTTWLWSFGCSGCPTQTVKNPTFTYSAPGLYSVTLQASNAAGSSSATEIVTVGSAPTASFLVSVSGQTVHVQDTSTNRPASWSWNFGDCAVNPGGCSTNAQGPHLHNYPNVDAKYTITLTVKNNLGESTKTAEVEIKATVPPPSN